MKRQLFFFVDNKNKRRKTIEIYFLTRHSWFPLFLFVIVFFVAEDKVYYEWIAEMERKIF